MPSSEAVYGGTLGSVFRLHLDVTLLSQDPTNNRSLVRLNAYLRNVSTSNVWNASSTAASYQYDGTTLNTSIASYGAGGSSYAPSSFNFVASNQDVYIYHDADGTKTANFSAYHNGTNSPYLLESTTSLSYTLPNLQTFATVYTTAASTITNTSAVVGGNVASSGNATITQRGVYYSSSNPTPTASNSVSYVVGTTGAYSSVITGLPANTLYYFRAYAINSQGTAYGAVNTFTTSVTPYAYLNYSTANPYASGSLLQDTGAGWTAVATSDLYFRTFSQQGATTVAQNSLDPSVMVQNALTYLNTAGGAVTYSLGSVGATSTTSSYTFISQTVYEVIEKALTLAPANWYWYIDPATNLLHFREKNNEPDHRIIMGKDIKTAFVEKRGEDIVNVVYFTGGDTGGGAILYRKYKNNYSIGLYGERSAKIIDERVTLAATAELISQNYLDKKAFPEVRLRCTIADSNYLTGAYDIETIQVGDVVNVQNVAGNDGSSVYDKAIFDVDAFDFNISKLSSLNLQVVRKEYSPDEVTVVCSTTPPEVTKRVEDISRNLENAQTINNPTTPS